MTQQHGQTTVTPEEQRPEREREVIVTETSAGRRTNPGAIVAAVVGLLVVLVVGWLLFNAGVPNAPVEVPSQIDVNVDTGASGGSGSGG